MEKKRMKPYMVVDILRNETDESHPITKTDLCKRIGQNGVPCDMRTLSRDIIALREMGFEIMETMVGHNRAYYFDDREFSVPEIKILIDAVQAASFITKEKTAELVDKLAMLGGKINYANLKNSVICFNNRKHTNKQIYISVQYIEEAIRLKKRLSFLYYDLNEEHKKVYRKNKWRYTVEPLALIYNEDNYYLMTYHTHLKNIVNYRVDRMDSVKVLTKDICEEARALMTAKSFSEYTEQMFKMYNGEQQALTLSFDDRIMGAVYDKFGEDAKIRRVDENTCELDVMVRRSPTFDAWVYQFGDKMKIVE